MLLSELKIGHKGRIVNVKSSPDSLVLVEFGIVPGAEIELTMIAPLGDPIAIKLLGATVALRKKEASLISVERID